MARKKANNIQSSNSQSSEAKSDNGPNQHVNQPAENFLLSSNLLRTILDGCADGVVVADANGHLLFFNRAAEKMTGFSATQASAQEWTDRHGCYTTDMVTPYPPGELPLVRAIRGETVNAAEVHLRNKRRPQGVWLSCNAQPLRDEADNIGGGILIIRDITERKQELANRRKAEDALATERNLLRTVIDNLPDRIFVKDVHGRFVLCNQATAHKHNASSPEDLRGKTDFDFLPKEWAERFREEEQQIIRTGQPLIGRQFVFAGPAGEEWIISTKVPLRDADGKIIGIVGSNRSITEQKQAEEALETERALLRTMIDNLPDNVYMKDTQGRFAIVNSTLVRNYGLSSDEEVLGKSDFDFLPQEKASRYYAEEQEIIRTGEPMLGREVAVSDPHGTHWFVSTKVPLRDRQGRIVGIVGSNRNITQRKQAEQEIQKLNEELKKRAFEQETRYRLAAKATNDAIWDWNLIANEVEWNEGVQILFGYDAGDVHVGIEWWSNRVHPEDRERVLTSIYSVIEGGGHTWSDEYRFACKDGSYAQVADRGYVVRDDDGRPVRMVGAMQDFTEHNRAQAALEHSLSLLEATLESTADGILVVDQDGKIVRFNQNFVDMWQIPDPIIQARDDQLAISVVMDQLKDPAGFAAKINDLYQQPNAESFDLLEFKDGKVFERYSKPQRLGERSVGRVWSFRDITERRRVEESLKGEREFLKTLLENLSEGIVVCDADGVLTLFNRATREFHGLPEEPIPAEQWAEHYNLYRPDGKTLLTKEEVPLYKALHEGSVRNAELMIVPKNAPPRTLLANGNRIETPDGKKLGAVIVAHDITERNRLQRELLQSQKLESIGTLAGGIAHDFNNLLAVVLGNATVHLRDRSLPAKVRDSLADIVNAAERGSDLTHQLLVYARGGLQKPAPCDLNVLVESVIKMLRRTTPPQIEFVLELASMLPPVMADPSQIEQVLMNLCLNAIQASSSPSRIEISTNTQTIERIQAEALELQPGQYVRLLVRDYGCGMDAHVQERIFEPFFSTKFTGRGMGLAASLGIVKSHQGQIQAESRPGTGTTMSLWLPVAAETTKARPAGQTIKLSKPPRGKETILVIDDDPAVARTVEQILSSLGYCVVAHTDAARAMIFLENNAEDVNLVVLDLNMPKYSGTEIFQRVAQRAPHAPILLASGFDDAEVIESLKKTGAAGFLQKPFTILTLARAIRKALDESEQAKPE